MTITGLNSMTGVLSIAESVTVPVNNIYPVLDYYRKASLFTLSSNNRHVSNGAGSGMVLATFKANTGKKYFEVKLTDTSYLYGGVGIATAAANWISSPGGDGPYDYMYGWDGYVYHNLSYYLYGPATVASPALTNVVIGCYVDLDAHTIGFIIGGVDYGIAYSGIASDYWYPMIGSYDQPNNLDVNFGQSSFSYLPSGYSGWSEVLDTDADNFISATSITDIVESNYVHCLVTELKSAGLYTNALGLYPMYGGNSSKCSKNLRNLSNNLSIVGTPTFASTGMTPSTSNYADTGINDTSLSYNACSIGYYSRTNNNIWSGDMGVDDAVSPYNHLWILFNTTTIGAWFMAGGDSAQGSITDSQGLFTISSDGAVKVYRNATLAGTSASISQNTKVNNTILIGAVRNGGSGSRECAFAFVYNQGLSGSDVSTLYNIIQRFETGLLRQV